MNEQEQLEEFFMKHLDVKKCLREHFLSLYVDQFFWRIDFPIRDGPAQHLSDVDGYCHNLDVPAVIAPPKPNCEHD